MTRLQPPELRGKAFYARISVSHQLRDIHVGSRDKRKVVRRFHQRRAILWRGVEPGAIAG